jgi:hypothetical protein
VTFYIVPIVAGQTEEGCVERLLHRIWGEILHRTERLQVIEPFRRPQDKLIHSNGIDLAEAVKEAFLKLKSKSKKDPEAKTLLLILLDAEKQCPATLGPTLKDIAEKALPANTPIACVLAKPMFENWIVGGASTLAGVNDLPNALPERNDCEERNGASWLGDQFRNQNPARKYKKTVDAEIFIRQMNLKECRENCPSFDKLCRDLEGCFPEPEATKNDEEQESSPE